MPPRSVVATQVDPDYFQFYARRADAGWATDQTTSMGYEAHLWSNGRFVTVRTARKFGTTAVAVEVWDAPPDPPDEHWQHVAEVSLEPDGPLEVFGWYDDTPAVIVPIDEGWVRLRVLWTGLVAGRFEGMDEDGNSEEHLMSKCGVHHGRRPPSSAGGRDGSCPTECRVTRRATTSRGSRSSPRAAEQAQDPDGSDDLPPSRPHARWGPEQFRARRVIDPVSETWWVDGSDIRRTLREVTQEEAQELMSRGSAV